jgi:hypothetical protein
MRARPDQLRARATQSTRTRAAQATTYGRERNVAPATSEANLSPVVTTRTLAISAAVASAPKKESARPYQSAGPKSHASGTWSNG